jgi:hypothetical protein
MASPPLTVTVAGRDLTASHDSLVFSNADPGGYEACQLSPQHVAGIRPGAPVVVRCGLEYAWHGRLNEPGEQIQGIRDTNTLAALGYGAALKDTPYQEIYVDRDFSRWQPAGTGRRLNTVPLGFNTLDAAVIPDTNTGKPALKTEASGTWAATAMPTCEAFYDAGDAIQIGAIYYGWVKDTTVDNTDVNWQWNVLAASDDVLGAFDTTGNLRAAGPDTGTLVASPGRRFGFVQLVYNAAQATDKSYPVYWTVLAVYGRHGLAKRGANALNDAQGFYPSDIFRDALARSGSGIAPGVIEDASGLTIPHLVYPTPTGADAVADQMAKLMAWHWGVWEPATVLDSQPTAHFRSPPSDATCVIGRADCLELDPPKVILDQLYDRALVSWRDAAGTSGTVTVTLANPLLSETGVGSRTLVLDAGTSTAAAAQTFGSFALLLAQRTARGGGYCLLGDTVALPGGGRKPACLLKAGRDRIRITDLPDSGPLHEQDTRRYDTFHVRRVETSIVNGQAQTRVDFDGGADLMEVLQARLAVQIPLG